MSMSKSKCTCGSHLERSITVSDVVKEMFGLCSFTLEQGVQGLWGGP